MATGKKELDQSLGLACGDGPTVQTSPTITGGQIQRNQVVMDFTLPEHQEGPGMMWYQHLALLKALYVNIN